MNPSLSERPLELINHICSFLDSPKDLLSFSLTSRRVCGTAIPNHIECRHIRCDVRCVALWRRLADLPWIASRFVSLEIIGRFERTALTSPIIPNHHPLLAIPDSQSGITTCWQEEPRDEYWSDCIHALAAAVRVMSGLRSFHWIDQEESYSMNDVFAALKNCSRLDDIQIVVTPEFDDEDEPYICHSQLWDLSDLRIFSFNCCDMTGTMDTDYINKYTKNMLNMLIHRSPGLEDLQLDLGDSEVDVGELFQHGCWPMLKRLTLASDIVMPEDDTMDRFLNAHPTLEHISIPFLSEVKAVRWMENVPYLRGLSCADPRNLESAISRHAFKFLKYLALDLSYSSATGNFCLQSLSQITSLRRLTLRGGQSPPGLLAEVARAVPQLERLHFNHYDGWESPTVSKIINDEDGAFSTRVTVLSHFRHLTHLSRFICLDQSPDGSVSNEAAVTELVVQCCATACPVLKYINLPTERRINHTRSWITIERNDDGSYARWEPTDDSEKAALEVETWGGFFLGAQQSYMSRYLR